MRTLVVGACGAFVLAMLVSMGSYEAVGGEKAKYTIKEVMKEAHKDGLLKKVSGGMGDKKDAERLLELYTALSKNTPPMGEKDSWKKITDDVVAAAKKAVAGDTAALKKAVNCGACHKAHKG
jgi:hypothetical protein